MGSRGISRVHLTGSSLHIHRAHALTLSILLAFLAFGSTKTDAAELVVWKAARNLEYRDDEIARQFRIALGSASVGPKSRQGDRKTPEGIYFITHKNSKSQFYLSLGISYPNLRDAKAGLTLGLITQREYDAIEAAALARRQPPQNTRLGGNIFIHGRGSASDWTWGCVALDDVDMKFLFDHVAVGDKVTIFE
jgi:murein L,D-transpeptidase YafK